jgi:N-acetylmuramoyl-L-alanine amidase
MNRSIFILFLFCAQIVVAQRFTQTVLPSDQRTTIALPPLGAAPFYSVSFVVYGANGEIQLFNPQEILLADEHMLEDEPARFDRQTYGPVFMSATAAQFDFLFIPMSDAPIMPDSIVVHVYLPKDQPLQLANLVPESEITCSCPLPQYFSKPIWCTRPDDCVPTSTAANTNVTHLIVHHSAGANTSNNWTAVVNSIWDYHVNTNGWSDIGYNWLIAPDGKIYQGRPDDKIGAHFCAQNSATMGVCMIGTYTSENITPLARFSLEQLLVWKACRNTLDPTDSVFHAGSQLVLPVISGHRDGCATSCPGNLLHAALPSIRIAVANRLVACQSTQLVDIEQDRHSVSICGGQICVHLPEVGHFPAQLILTDALGSVVHNKMYSNGQDDLIDVELPNIIFYRLSNAVQQFSGVLIGTR